MLKMSKNRIGFNIFFCKVNEVLIFVVIKCKVF